MKTAHLAADVTPDSKDGVEVAVEVAVMDQYPLAAPVAVPLAHLLSEDGGARLVPHLVGLDVQSPGAAARRHGPIGLARERLAAAGEVPLGVENAHAGVPDCGDQLARPVLRAAD